MLDLVCGISHYNDPIQFMQKNDPHVSPLTSYKPNIGQLPIVVLSIRMVIVCCTTLLARPSLCIPPALGHVHSQPKDQSRRDGNRKQEREPLPSVFCPVDDRLDHVRPKYRRRASRQSKQAKELAFQFGQTGQTRTDRYAGRVILVGPFVRTIKSKPGGESSAISVCEYEK